MGPKYMLFAFNSRPAPAQTEVKQFRRDATLPNRTFQLQTPILKKRKNKFIR